MSKDDVFSKLLGSFSAPAGRPRIPPEGGRGKRAFRSHRPDLSRHALRLAPAFEVLAVSWVEGGAPGAAAAAHTGGLTLRECQVLKLIAEGRSSRDIAGLLSLSPRTVEHHRTNLMTKLRLKGVADLVKYALAEGYV